MVEEKRELNLSKGEFEGIFTLIEISGNRRCVWMQENSTGRKRVMTVMGKNIHLFQDKIGDEFLVRREVKKDLYIHDGEVLLSVSRNNRKNKANSKKRKKKKK